MDWNKVGALASVGSFLVGTLPLIRAALGESQFADAIRSRFALSFFAIGTLLAIVSLVLTKKHKDVNLVDNSRQSISDVGNPVQNVNANPVAVAKYEEHHHHYPTPAGAVSSPASIRPNIELGEVKEYQVYLDSESNKYCMGAKGRNFTRAILLQVINRAGSGTREVTVKASATFDQGGRSATVSPMVWVGEYFNHVELAPLEQGYLILGVMQRGLTSLETGRLEPVWVAPRNNRSSGRTTSSDNAQLSFIGGIRAPLPATVTVELVSYTGDLLQTGRFIWAWTTTDGVIITRLA